MTHFARLPAALVPAAFGPGRPGLLRCCQGGLACLTSARIRGQGAGSGLKARWSRTPAEAASPGAGFWETIAVSYYYYMKIIT